MRDGIWRILRLQPGDPLTKNDETFIFEIIPLKVTKACERYGYLMGCLLGFVVFDFFQWKWYYALLLGLISVSIISGALKGLFNVPYTSGFEDDSFL